MKFLGVLFFALALSNIYQENAIASTPDFTAIVDSIYTSEGGAKTHHPYGILATYKHTTPRQACFNTVKHKYRDWVSAGSKGDFLVYLASKYAPRHVFNDPTDLNRHWLSNVRANL